MDLYFLLHMLMCQDSYIHYNISPPFSPFSLLREFHDVVNVTFIAEIGRLSSLLRFLNF